MRGWLLGVSLWLVPAMACAGAWPQARGETQVIASFETAHADRGFGEDRTPTTPLSVYRKNDTLIFAQHGLTERLTLTGKTGWQSYETEFESRDGPGPVEVGLRYNLHRSVASVISVAASVEGLGEGKRSEVDLAGTKGTDVELRALYGRNLTIRGTPAFVNLELGWRYRESTADQIRFDGTLGLKLDHGVMVLTQVFAGQTETVGAYRGEWVNTQVSVTRRLGENTLQVGWRKTVAGRFVPEADALIVGLWRDF